MSDLQLKKINDIAVKPIIQSKLAKDDILGYHYFPTLYSNIYIKTGKTTLIYNVLKHCTYKKTKVVFFCSTIHRDATYKKIGDVGIPLSGDEFTARRARKMSVLRPGSNSEYWQAAGCPSLAS